MLSGLVTVLPALAEGNGKSLQDYNGKCIGVLTGSVQEDIVRNTLPDAELKFFMSDADSITALLAGNIDGFIAGDLTLDSILKEHRELTYVDAPIYTADTAFAFAKTDEGAALRDKMNEYFASVTADGSMDEILDKWLSSDHEVDLSGLTAENGTLVLATSATAKPFSYFYNGKVTGFEIELAAGFCREYGYGLDIQTVDFSGILPGLKSGKFDIGSDVISITEERKQSVHFSDPYYQAKELLVVRAKTPEVSPAGEFTCIADFNREDVTLGIVTGMSYDMLYAEFLPKAKVQYYNSTPDLLNAIKTGQVAGAISDGPLARYMVAHNEGLAILDEPVGEPLSEGFAVARTEFGHKIRDELSEFIVRMKNDGSMEEILALWNGSDEEHQVVSVPTEGANGTVRAAVYSGMPPAGYLKDGQLVGSEIDILCRFCTEYGYALEMTDVNFDGLISGLTSGRYDLVAAFLTITEERKESVDFTEPYISDANYMMIAAPTEDETDFWDDLAASFERTFIREARWKLIVQGIWTTVVITVCAAVLGTVLGFGLCLLRRLKNPIAHGFTTVYIRVLQGTPLLVLLMILYYIIFAKSGISGELVAIIAFALNFAAYVCEMFRTGIESVDIGQTEAALAIGFTKRQTFFRIVMPQAAEHFLPVYKGEFISLLKMTSVVGYIAVQDLTKMSDIIRSRTYEAFFPLIATAIIYFILAALLTALLRAVELKVEPDRKNRKVKGVKMQ